MLLGLILIAQIIIFLAGWHAARNNALRMRFDAQLPLPIRIVLSISLMLSAFLIWENSPNVISTYSFWVLTGMIFSFIGDLTMADLIPIPNQIIGGMLSFGVAHILYIVAYVKTIHLNGLIFTDLSFYLVLTLYSLLFIGGWWFFIHNPKREIYLNATSLIYGLCIGIMASASLSLSLKLNGAWWMTAIGALSFVISDFIIGVTKIGTISLKNPEIYIWLTYIIGQIGIIYAPWFGSIIT